MFFTKIDSLGAWAGGIYIIIFLLASLVMIWRLECMSSRGFDGTALGTLVMPYCSGLGNLIFIWVLSRSTMPASEGMVNSLVNNATNMTLLIGLPALIWGLNLHGDKKLNKKQKKEFKLNKLSLLLTLAAVLFFNAVVWALGKDGVLNKSDGLVLIALFFFWQCFEVFDVLKNNVHSSKKLSWWYLFDVGLLLMGAYGLYVGIEGLLYFIEQSGNGILKPQYLGWFCGCLMVVPNALLAFYYAHKKRADIVYASQVGDGHICIPLAIGLLAICKPIAMPNNWEMGLLLISLTVVMHGLFVGMAGRLPRWAGGVLIGAYFYFIYLGLG